MNKKKGRPKKHKLTSRHITLNLNHTAGVIIDRVEKGRASEYVSELIDRFGDRLKRFFKPNL